MVWPGCKKSIINYSLTPQLKNQQCHFGLKIWKWVQVCQHGFQSSYRNYFSLIVRPQLRKSNFFFKFANKRQLVSTMQAADHHSNHKLPTSAFSLFGQFVPNVIYLLYSQLWALLLMYEYLFLDKHTWLVSILNCQVTTFYYNQVHVGYPGH